MSANHCHLGIIEKSKTPAPDPPEAGFFVKFHALASFLPPHFRSPLGERFAGDLP